MEIDELENDDVYVNQLKQVYDSCDLGNKGYLNCNEVVNLAQKLQLGDQVSILIKELFGDNFVDNQKTISFEEFREGFVTVLANEIDCLDDITEDDHSEWSELEIGEGTKAINKESPSLESSESNKKNNHGQLDVIRAKSLPSADSGNVDGDASSEALQLRQIWDDLGIGETGYINMVQLSEVCSHLEMDSMDEDAIEILFLELDKDEDGLISFAEFMEGLFIPNTPRSLREELQSPHNEKEKDWKEYDVNVKDISQKASKKNVQRVITDLLGALDPENTGEFKYADLQRHLKDGFDDVSMDLQQDKNGKIAVESLEDIVLDGSDTIAKLLLVHKKKQIDRLCEDLENSSGELEAARMHAKTIGKRNKLVTEEFDQQNRDNAEENEKNLKKQSQEFAKKLAQREKKLIDERDTVLELHRSETKELQEKLEEIKAEDVKTKKKLKDAEIEIEKLEGHLTDITSKLTLEQQKVLAILKEPDASKQSREKIDDLEGQVKILTDIRAKEKVRIKHLENSNKTLQTQNEDYETQIKWLNEEKGNVQKIGSYLSDYVKPDIVQWNQLERSLDASSNEETETLLNKITEQEDIINGLRRDLQTLNNMLEENEMSTKERHNREINRLTDKYASEIADLQLMLSVERNELLQHHSKEKSGMIDDFAFKIEEMKKNFSNDRETLINEHKHEIKRLEQQLVNENDLERENLIKRDIRKMEKLFKEEKDEIESNHRNVLTGLRQQIVTLETEKAEMELQYVNERAELEQQFRIERAELLQNASNSTREYDKSQKYIDFLKEDLASQHENALEDLGQKHRKEKDCLMKNAEKDISDLISKHEKEVADMSKNFENQVSELQNSFAVEQASLRESFSRERTEIQQKFTREKKEMKDLLQQDYEHRLAIQLAELRKVSVEERSRIEEELRDEKNEVQKNWQDEKNMYQRKLKHIQNELELSFAEEKDRMKKDFELEKSVLEKKYKREVSELQQAFSFGEAGLKGKMKEEFQKLLHKQREELEESYQIEKDQLLFSFNRERSTLQSNWQLEKLSLKENFKREREQIVEEFANEKQEQAEKNCQHVHTLEELLRKEKERHKGDRDLVEDNNRLHRETQQLQETVQYLEGEVDLLNEQKKEMETRNQVLELKHLSRQQEEIEAQEFIIERDTMKTQLNTLVLEVEQYKVENESLKSDMSDSVREMDTILENSVQEITDQQANISSLQAENEMLQSKITDLLHVVDDYKETKKESVNLIIEKEELQKTVESFAEIQQDHQHLHESLKSSQVAARELEMRLLDKTNELSCLHEELLCTQSQLERMELMCRKEVETQKERLNAQLTTAATENSRNLRKIQELEDQLFKASTSSDRDSALKDKVFNDAKAEVLNLNKKLEEKSRRIRTLEESLQEAEAKFLNADIERNSLDEEVQHWKTVMNENSIKSREEKNDLTTKSIRSNTLVTELYIENGDLMKQVADAETNQFKAEKQIRQLTDQKRALQRVVAKLCNTYGISDIP